ncbi:unnamed protein product [Calicophoron daubneyi]|uniref:Uncharacterized protein n=1 Tax=Calicophoron daubneyi TaxID=300641 RepID=A0AAV2T6G9_CALDB
MPDLLTNPLGAVKAEFLRLPIPESLVISLRASHCHNTADNGPCLSVATLLCTSSPLENTLTGYQHLRLPFLKCEGGGTTQVSEKDPEISVPHPVLHKSLQDCVGLVIFCKIDLNAYTPTSLGDLVDTLSKAFSSRASSLTRPQTKEGQPHPLCREGSVTSFVKPNVPRDRCKDMIMLGIDSSWIYPNQLSNSQKPQP